MGLMKKPVSVSVSDVPSDAVRVSRTEHDVSPAGNAGIVIETVDVLHPVTVDVAFPEGHTNTTDPVVVPKPVPESVTALPMIAPVDVAGVVLTRSGYT